VTCGDIVALATARTEQRGVKVLNLYAELLIVIQEFCKSHAWEWRKKIYSFSTVATTPKYALPVESQSTQGSACDVDDIENVQIITAPDDADLLDEVVSEIDQARRQSMDTSERPDSYFRALGDYTSLILSPTPDAVYPMVLVYWAIPVDAITQDSAVPLVPPQLHGVLAKGFEAFILRYTLGEESAKYESAKAEYEAQLVRAWGGQ